MDLEKLKEKVMNQSRRESWVSRRASVQSQASFAGSNHCGRDSISGPTHHKLSMSERITVMSPAKDENSKTNSDITQCHLLLERYHVETNHKEYFMKPYNEVKRQHPEALFEFFEKNYGMKQNKFTFKNLVKQFSV